MEGGRVRMEGEPDALLGNPEMASLYLGGTIEQPVSGTGSPTTASETAGD
jgi:hypothetical protein